MRHKVNILIVTHLPYNGTVVVFFIKPSKIKTGIKSVLHMCNFIILTRTHILYSSCQQDALYLFAKTRRHQKKKTDANSSSPQPQ